MPEIYEDEEQVSRKREQRANDEKGRERKSNSVWSVKKEKESDDEGRERKCN